MKYKLKAGATDDVADSDSDKVEHCDTDSTTNQYVFERTRSANKKLKRAVYRRTISNKLGSDQTYSTANNDDNNFSSYENDFDDIIKTNTKTKTATSASSTQLDIHFMWIFLRDLLTSLVSTNDNETNTENTENNFELNTSSSECDYLEDNDYLTIIDGDLNNDEKSYKHKLLKQKLLGNFHSIFYKTNALPLKKKDILKPSHQNPHTQKPIQNASVAFVLSRVESSNESPRKY